MNLIDANLGGKVERWSDNASYKSFASPNSIESVLVIKLDHVGDFILGLDAILALRKKFPTAVIDLACGPWNAGLARSLGLFNQVFAIKFFGTRADGEQPVFDITMLSELSDRRYDLAIDLRVDPDTRIVLRNVEARFKAGFECGEHNEALTLVLPHHINNNIRNNIGIHQTLLMLRLVRSVSDIFTIDDGVSSLIRSRISQHVDLDLTQARGRVLIVCNTSSGRAAKNWPIDRFRRLIRWLAVEIDAVVVLVGSPDQATEARDTIQFCSSKNVLSAVGETSLGQAVNLISQSSLYIGNDSGLTHVAARLGIPTVAIFSGIDPTAIWAPVGEHVTVLRSPVSCSPCHIAQLDDCYGGHACILNVSEGAVRAGVRQHLMLARRYGDPDVVDPDSTRTIRNTPLFKGWASSKEVQVPQRYSDNLERYDTLDTGLRLEHLLHGFKAGNSINRGDLNRFYMLTLVFDQITKEGVHGDLAELGVYKGNTAYMIADLARRIGSTAYLLDTFSGFADSDLTGVDSDKQMEFADTSLEQVQALVGTANTRYVQGYFPGTADQIPSDARFAFVHIDCDLYAPFMAALEFFYERLVPGGFLVMHDYASLHWQGAERAVDRFFAGKSESVVPVPDGAGSVMVRKAKVTGASRTWLSEAKTSGFARAWVAAGGSAADDFLAAGWAGSEAWGVWGLGHRHELLVLLDAIPEVAFDLEIESLVVLAPVRDSQTISVTIQGEVMARWTYDVESNRGVRRVSVPLKLIGTEQDCPAFRLVFEAEDCRSPHSVDDANPDDRPLGMGLIRFRQRRH